ncbi:MAG: hypothetical protein MR416_03035 [Lachnospiraceae bacterium]|nr:hypothetical protein [Lachnospiraceae bacterium]MDD7024360.1 hypothetical protein [Oscillospiraceae bacterium]MDY5541449.1 hypothetical protein [Lachnospiraceae bacterium]MDY5648432.1 hypothetical protein [Lachnospiraceae bacterium]
MSSKVHFTRKDTYIVYDNRRSIVNYIIIGISVLAITLTGIAYSVSLKSVSSQEMNSAIESELTGLQESVGEIL